VLFLGHLPWWPDAFEVYDRRNGHVEFREPGHASLMQFVDRLGFYDSAIVQVGVPLLLVLTFGAYVMRWIDVREGIVLASLWTLVLQPDHSYTRALFAALPFLFLIELTVRRWAVIWIVSAIASAGIYLQQERGELGGYGSLKHVVVSNAFLVLVIAYYVRDKVRGDVQRPALEPTAVAG
jgi:hypothetical protein